jgi:hypothetical protein
LALWRVTRFTYGIRSGLIAVRTQKALEFEEHFDGKIRASLGKPELSPIRKIDDYDIDEQAWLNTRDYFTIAIHN